MIYVIGIGPGKKEHMTLEAVDVLDKCDVIIGYKTYISLIEGLIEGKTIVQNGMRQEIDRCREAITLSRKGHTVGLISGGDSGIYGMAGLMLELNSKEDIKEEVKIIQGVTSSVSAASAIGAPLMHDICQISLSDLMTPWEVIEKRLKLAAEADFVICLYNPKSKGRTEHLSRAFEIMSEFKSDEIPVGIVKNAGRINQEYYLVKFGEMNFDICDMSTMVIIGNKETFIDDGKMITPRGYGI